MTTHGNGAQAHESNITIGGKRYEIEPFTFEELRKMLPTFALLKGGVFGGGFEAAGEIVALALRKPPEEFGEMKTTAAEVWSAVPVIAKVSGLEILGERPAAANRTA